MDFTKKYLIITGLTILILLSLLFIIGETSFKTSHITQYIPPASTQVAAVSAPTSGLVAHYTFDDTTNDSAGSNNGTISGGATYVDGKIGRALQFDGVDDYVNAGTGSLITNLGPMTISFWMYTTTTAYGYLVSKEDSNSGGHGWAIWKTSRNGNPVLRFSVAGFITDLSVDSSDNTYALNKWNHVTVTWDGSMNTSGVNFFVNGSSVVRGAGNNGSGALQSDATRPLYIGGNPSEGRYVDAIIDEVRIYSRILDSNEIRQLYAFDPAMIAGDTISSPSSSQPPVVESGNTQSGSCPLNTYYIDFENGIDSNDGKCSTTAWKHSPGDPNATGNVLTARLNAGDTILFKGGVVYDGSITVGQSGIQVATGMNGYITSDGILSDFSSNFSSVKPGDYVYVYNNSTSGSWIETVGLWSVSVINSSNQLSLNGFNGVSHQIPELAYKIYRPITFTSNSSWGNGQAILTGGGVLGTGVGRDYIFNINQKSYIRIANLMMKNTRDVSASGCTGPDNRGAIWDGNSTNYEGLIVEDSNFQDVWSAVVAGPIDYSVFKNNTVNNVARLGIVGGKYALTENNTIFNGSSNIRGQLQYSVIRFNKIQNGYRTAASICGYHTDGIGPIFSASAAPGSNKYGWIYGNIIDGPVEGIFLSGDNGGTPNWTIHDNIIIGHSGTGQTGSGDAALLIYNAPGTRIYNNVILGINGSKGWGRAMAVDEPLGYGRSTGLEFKNNIIYSLDPSPIGVKILIYPNDKVHPSTSSDFHIDGNIYYAPNVTKENVGVFFGFGDPTAGNLTPKSFAFWQSQGFDAGGYSSANVDPQFVNPVASTWQDINVNLKNGSPALGSPYTLGIQVKDFAGNLRSASGSWVRGAYEYTGGGVQPVNPPVTPSTPGDFNSDGSVNALDFSAMKVYWNQNNTTYDLNKDGIVNSLDFSIMATHWTG